MYVHRDPVPVFGQVADPASVQAQEAAASRARMWRNVRIGALVVGGVGAVVLVVKGRPFSAVGVAAAGLLGAGVAKVAEVSGGRSLI